VTVDGPPRRRGRACARSIVQGSSGLGWVACVGSAQSRKGDFNEGPLCGRDHGSHAHGGPVGRAGTDGEAAQVIGDTRFDQVQFRLSNPKKVTPSELRKFAQDMLETPELTENLSVNPEAAKYLILSGILFEYLSTHEDSSFTPEVLYWLGRVDRTLNNTFFYSLADMYLKECILKYSQSKVAEKCYNEYELNMVLAYSGSGGTNLPYDVQQELASLKLLVKPKKINGPK
jgi:hypothetical protein